jgi:hypothetical protein
MRRAHARHAAGDVAGGAALAREALASDAGCVEALEHLATVLVTRQRKHAEGLALIDEAVRVRKDDAGLWYARGWLYEFVAHETRRRQADAPPLSPRDRYEVAALSFRRCLELKPEGKLAGDAADLLDHVENELLSL